MKELPALSGTVSVRGTVAYASQEACVFSTTLRENILFGLPYEDEWYRTVVHACALEKVKLAPFRRYYYYYNRIYHYWRMVI